MRRRRESRPAAAELVPPTALIPMIPLTSRLVFDPRQFKPPDPAGGGPHRSQAGPLFSYDASPAAACAAASPLSAGTVIRTPVPMPGRLSISTPYSLP